MSLWSHVEARRRFFANKAYAPGARVIYPLTGRQHLVLFESWFQRSHARVLEEYWK